MINVLYITSTLKRSGPSNQLFNIINNLDKSKYKPLVLTLSPEESDTLISKYEKNNIRVISLGLSRIKGLLYSVYKVKKVIVDENIDIVHTQGLRADIISSKINLDIIKFATIRNYPQLDFVMTYGVLKGKLFTYFQVKSLRKLHKCVGVSNAVADNLTKNFGLSNVVSILNGVDSDHYKPLCTEDRTELQEKLNIDDKRINIFTTLGSDERKNSEIVAKACAMLKDDPRFYFIFAGEGKQSSICKSITHDNNSRYVGRVTNVAEYLKSTDLFVSASRAEGMPNAVLEALSTDLPCILSDIPPHIELKKIASDFVEVFNIDSAEDLKGKILNYGKLNRENKNINTTSARDIVLRELSDRVMSMKYQNLYSSYI